LKKLFLLLQTLSGQLKKGDFTKTTLPIGWLLFTLLAAETDKNSMRCAKKIFL